MADRSEIFTIGIHRYVRATTRRLILRHMWLPAAVLAALSAAGFNDSRFWYLALIILFIIYPMAVSMMWISLAAKPELTALSRPQRWSFGSDSLTIDVYPFEYDTTTECAGTFTVPFDKIRTVETGRITTVYLEDGTLPYPFLLIPSDLIPEAGHKTLYNI